MIVSVHLIIHHDPKRSLEIIFGIMIMIYSDNNHNYEFNWESKIMSVVIAMISLVF